MHFRPFGRTDLRVSELCLGTMHFGWKTDERTSAAILDAFRAAGGNFIQAAVGTPVGSALDLPASTHAESHVGAWLARGRIPRESVVLATRLIIRSDATSDAELTRSLRAACVDSLRRLRTGYLDLLLCEWDPVSLSTELVQHALWPLVRDGLVRYTGVSSLPAWRIAESCAIAMREALPRFEAVQEDLSLVSRRAFEAELAEFCREKRFAFLARSPLAGGFLVDGPPRWRAWTSTGRETRLRRRFSNHRSLGARDALAAVALSRGVSVAQAALAWVLARPEVTAAVVGVTTPTHLADLLKAPALVFSPDEMAMLENPAAFFPETSRFAHGPASLASAHRERAWPVPLSSPTPSIADGSREPLLNSLRP